MDKGSSVVTMEKKRPLHLRRSFFEFVDVKVYRRGEKGFFVLLLLF